MRVVRALFKEVLLHHIYDWETGDNSSFYGLSVVCGHVGDSLATYFMLDIAKGMIASHTAVPKSR